MKEERKEGNGKKEQEKGKVREDSEKRIVKWQSGGGARAISLLNKVRMEEGGL